MGKTIALFGGSFNPVHEGHFTMASYIQETLAVDETWMLFSQNPDKDPAAYPSLEHRMNMAHLMATHYHPSIVLSDKEAKIAKQIGRNDTYYILQELQKQHPEDKFIFVMGADCFTRFHEWKERDAMMNEYLIAIVGRPGYNEGLMDCPTAVAFRESLIDMTDPATLNTATQGWCFMSKPYIPSSSSDLVKQIASGVRDFQGNFADVANYIFTHNLYNSAHGGPTCGL